MRSAIVARTRHPRGDATTSEALRIPRPPHQSPGSGATRFLMATVLAALYIVLALRRGHVSHGPASDDTVAAPSGGAPDKGDPGV